MDRRLPDGPRVPDPSDPSDPGLAHDVICFDSFLDQKMLERWLLRCHSSVVVVKFWVLRPVIVTVVICWDVMLRILVPNLFYFDLEYFFRDLCKHLVYDVSHPWSGSVRSVASVGLAWSKWTKFLSVLSISGSASTASPRVWCDMWVTKLSL